MPDGKDVVVELQLEELEKHSVGRSRHRAERVPAEVLLIVGPQSFRQHFGDLAVVEPVRVDDDVVHARVLDVDHAELLGKVFCELRLADGVSTLHGDLVELKLSYRSSSQFLYRTGLESHLITSEST